MTTSGAPTNSPSNATTPCGIWNPHVEHPFRIMAGAWLACPGVKGPAPVEPAPDVAVFYSVGYLDHAGRPRPLDLAKWTPDRRRAVAAVASFNSEYATATPYFVIEQTITTSAVRRAI
jgi:hypothetical protein